ncbi:hypothetical protein SynBIOSU31_02001 [Synechococcus sp. BIOS-U3-1]|nr:hypothetical protein SynBIOSU31_02001 [Synechococcus sp. BIOS-U3-1]
MTKSDCFTSTGERTYEQSVTEPLKTCKRAELLDDFKIDASG